MHDPDVVFDKLMLKSGDIFLDVGCGAGDYSLYASKIVGETGKIYALDMCREYLKKLEDIASTQHIGNIYTKACDIRDGLDFESDSIDVCFISTVMHILGLTQLEQKLFNDISRILKPEGCLSIIECKKEPMQFGPPLNMRISVTELENSLGKYGFTKTDYIDLGVNYMAMFVLMQ